VVLDDVGDEPVGHVLKSDRPHHPIHLLSRHIPRLQQEDCQELSIDVPGLPKGPGQLVVDLDLLRQHPDVTVLHAELIVAGTAPGVVCPPFFIAERLELLQGFIERHRD
jgi:hypothetical protein